MPSPSGSSAWLRWWVVRRGGMPRWRPARRRSGRSRPHWRRSSTRTSCRRRQCVTSGWPPLWHVQAMRCVSAALWGRCVDRSKPRVLRWSQPAALPSAACAACSCCPPRLVLQLRYPCSYPLLPHPSLDPQVARAREAAAEQKLRAAMEAARRKLHLVQRLERAEGARQEALMAVMAGQARRSSEGFLTREAVRRTQLRRRSSSRKLQAAWRAFCEHRQTTRGLAAAFVDTGVPFTCADLGGVGQFGIHRMWMAVQRVGTASQACFALESSKAICPRPPCSVPLGQATLGSQVPSTIAASRSPAALSPHGVSADPTPAGTPDSCGSPTSSVRRQDGRLASAPVSIPQTPTSTPLSTPGPSLAGSPIALARRQAAAERCATAGATAEAKLEMPPLRSIAVPAGSPLPVAPVVGAGTFEHLAATLSARSTLNAAQVPGLVVEPEVQAHWYTDDRQPPSRSLGEGLKARLPQLPAVPPCPLQALLQRLESRVTVKGVSTGCCAGLLRRLFPRVPPGCTTERYPPRIFLCAYMILGHPGERVLAALRVSVLGVFSKACACSHLGPHSLFSQTRLHLPLCHPPASLRPAPSLYPPTGTLSSHPTHPAASCPSSCLSATPLHSPPATHIHPPLGQMWCSTSRVSVRTR